MDQDHVIAPVEKWKDLSVAELYRVKSEMLDLYFKMRDARASFASQYYSFILQLDALIERKQHDDAAGED